MKSIQKIFITTYSLFLLLFCYIQSVFADDGNLLASTDTSVKGTFGVYSH